MGNFTYKQSHKNKGLCVDCSKYVQMPFIRCPEHHAKLKKHNRRTMREKRKLYVVNGRCISCGAQLHPEMDAKKTHCIHCREHPWR